MIELTFPDGSKKQFETPPTGVEVARGISENLAREAVAVKLNGSILDLKRRIEHSASIRLITTRDPEALEILRHSAAHVMAQAIMRIYPGARLTIGPVVGNEFYYDIDMETVYESDFSKIEKEMKKIVEAKLPVERREVPKAEALLFFKNEPYKVEMVSGLEDGTITFYSQGEFTDLCRGPHVPHTGFVRAFKLTKVSGAYWRGDQANPQLQRIYGTAFFSKKDLDAYLHFLEEAKKRNHRKLGTLLELFSFHDEAPGMPFFHPKGMAVWNQLLEYWREEHKAAGYVETKTPILLSRTLWERSGHWENYRENMYFSKIDESRVTILPSPCATGR